MAALVTPTCQSQIANRQSQITSRQSPITNRQSLNVKSPIAESPISPIFNHWSTTNLQSLVNYQSPIAIRQSLNLRDWGTMVAATRLANELWHLLPTLLALGQRASHSPRVCNLLVPRVSVTGKGDGQVWAQQERSPVESDSTDGSSNGFVPVDPASQRREWKGPMHPLASDNIPTLIDPRRRRVSKGLYRRS